MKYKDYALMREIMEEELMNSLKKNLPSFFEPLPEYVQNIVIDIAEEGYILPYYLIYNNDKSSFDLPDEEKNLLFKFRDQIEEYLGEYILDSIGGASITFYRDSPDFKVEYH
jgi:hypothetical protein